MHKLCIASELNHLLISGIREWSRWYETRTSRPLNGFECDEKYFDTAARRLFKRQLRSGGTVTGTSWTG